MNAPLRFAEAVCAGHPDRLADSIADRIVALAVAPRSRRARRRRGRAPPDVVFVDGRIAAGPGAGLRRLRGARSPASCARRLPRAPATAPDGFGPRTLRADTVSGCEFDLCLGPLEADERAFRSRVRRPGHRRRLRLPGRAGRPRPPRAGARARLREGARGSPAGVGSAAPRSRRQGPRRRPRPAARGGLALAPPRRRMPTGGALPLAVRRRASRWRPSTSPPASWSRSTRRPRGSSTAPGSFAIGGPLGDNGLSGKKLVAEAFGTAVPIGGGTMHGKDPHKPDVRAQRIARERAVARVREGAAEATVWVVFRPGDEEPRWVEERVVPAPESGFPGQAGPADWSFPRKHRGSVGRGLGARIVS